MKHPMRVKCDQKECNWKQAISNIEDIDSWLEKPCPQCGLGFILTAKDVQKIKEVLALIALNDVIVENMSPDEVKEKTTPASLEVKEGSMFLTIKEKP